MPELLDYVTLKFELNREELEAKSADFFAKVPATIEDALKEANLTREDITQVELLGGGIRTPKMVEALETALDRKDLSYHLNGDEAMCFGSAFIASNSSSMYKVKHLFLTQNPKYDVYLKIQPLKPEDSLTEEEQLAEGIEANETVKYN